uniref:Prostaglandin G/H synthase 1 n=1 Tax=Tetraodon nigroviridis TaxID=99883 RepID=H3C1G5_TETNG
VNPCCYYPCQNRGVCVRYGTDQYKCDCTRTGYSGVNCTDPGFWAKVHTMLKPSPQVQDYILRHFEKFWDYVNNSPLRDTFMRIVLTGETIKIIIEEYVQQLSGYFFKLKFDPTLLFKEQFQYSNRIAVEFDHLYHWHSLLPDSYLIDGDEISATGFVFNGSVLANYGVEKMVDSFSRQIAGQIGGGQNFHESIIRVIRSLLHHGREVRLQPFNEYRKKFDQKPYESFSELTDNEEIAKGLEEAYGDIDALEFFPGIMLEKTSPGHIFGESMFQMGAPFSLKGLMGNAICSPEYWKPSTFGGETGFNIIKTATLEKLVCLNTKWCPYVSFRVP